MSQEPVPVSHETSTSSSDDMNPTVSAMQRLSTFKFVKSKRKRASNGSGEVAIFPKRHLPSMNVPTGDDDVMDVPIDDISINHVALGGVSSKLCGAPTALSTGNARSSSSSSDLDSSVDFKRSINPVSQVSSANLGGLGTLTACTVSATPVFRLPPGVGPSLHSDHRSTTIVTPSRQAEPKPSRLSSNLATPTRIVNSALSNRTANFAKPLRLGSNLATPLVSSAPGKNGTTPIALGCKHRATTSSQFKSTAEQRSSTIPSHCSDSMTPFNSPSITQSPSNQHPPSMISSISLSTSVDSLSTPLQTAPIRSLNRPSTTSYSTPVSRPSSVVSSSTPLHHKLTPSIATPLNRVPPSAGSITPLTKQPAPLICTPSARPDFDTVDILRTPVPLAQRKFPGPAGLLPPMVRGWGVDSYCLPWSFDIVAVDEGGYLYSVVMSRTLPL